MGNYKRSQGHVLHLSQPVVTYETVVPNPKLKLLDQVREVMRLKHYSIRTERAYCDWIKHDTFSVSPGRPQAPGRRITSQPVANW